MRRIVLTDSRYITPFNEPARDLRVLNKPLWLHQKDLFTPYSDDEREYPDLDVARIAEGDEQLELIIHKDNIFFNAELVATFLKQGRAGGKPVQIAFSINDPAIREHARPLATGFKESGDLLLAEMWYLPKGITQLTEATPLLVDTEARELGYYHVPPYMASDTGDLVYQLPKNAFVILESWVHVFIIDILFGVFATGAAVESRVSDDWRYRLKIFSRAIVEQKQVLDCSELVKIGKNVNIDPSAVIHGPSIIGDNVTIGPGTVIDNCIIGNNVNISQGCQLMLSVINDGCFLPFRAALFMTTLMENTMVAQNTCLQLCVVGRDSFIGAGNTFTDFNVLPAKLRAINGDGVLERTDMYVLGGCVGHHCRLSSGVIIHPARTVESDVVLIASNERRIISKNIVFEDSDHHQYQDKYPYPRLYPREGEW